jgi:hypothetical protein
VLPPLRCLNCAAATALLPASATAAVAATVGLRPLRCHCHRCAALPLPIPMLIA